MSSQNLYEKRFSKFIDRYFEENEFPIIYGHAPADNNKEVEIEEEQIKELLLNIFREKLAKSTAAHSRFEEIAFDAFNEFLETAQQTFGINEYSEKTMLKLIFSGLNAQILEEALDEKKEATKRNVSGMERRVIKFEKPTNIPSGKK
ncbi:hypothetical protein KKC32_02175 [Patescibacteria group bacterium]|nr:hypothetical protein [Patescibacteria group bacterium]